MVTVTVDDQTHVLFVCCFVVWFVTIIHACDYLYQYLAAPAFGFLFACLILQIINGTLLEYSIGWNVQDPNVTWIVILLLTFFLQRGLEGVMEFAVVIFAGFLLVMVAVAGQTYLVNWVDSQIGLSVGFGTILILITVVGALLWIVMKKLEHKYMGQVIVAALTLVIASTAALQIFIAGGLWNMWSSGPFEVSWFEDDWLYVEFGVIAVLYVAVYWYVYRHKPLHRAKAKLSHDHLHHAHKHSNPVKKHERHHHSIVWPDERDAQEAVFYERLLDQDITK